MECEDACDENRFEIIKKAKEHLLKVTNIDRSPDEMKVLDSFLFRCWQMGWLREYDDDANAKEVERLKKHLISVNCSLKLHENEAVVPTTRDVLVMDKLLCECRLNELGYRDDALKIGEVSTKATGIVKSAVEAAKGGDAS